MREAPRRVGPVIGVALIVGTVIALALTIPTRPSLALGVSALVLALSAVLAAPSLLLAIVFAATFAYWRVGPSYLNMSVCDAMTVLALLAALPSVPWRSRALKRVLIGLAFYLALIAVTLLAHSSNRAIAEWLHRGVLFGGAIMIGAAVAHRRETVVALRAFVCASAIVAIGAIYESLTSSFEAAYPFGMHKNAAGALLAIAIIVLIVAPSRLALRSLTIRYFVILLIVGLVATQSRGAALALVAALAIHSIRRRSGRRRAPVLLLTLSLALIVGSAITLNEELKTNPKFNAIESRADAFDVAINDVWLVHPLVGGGLRWFQESDASNAGVHNEIIAELSEVGLIGLFGLVVLMGNALLVLRRRRGPVGEMAMLSLVFLLLFGLTEILWAAGALTVTMLMVGLAVGERPARTVGTDQDAAAPVTT